MRGLLLSYAGTILLLATRAFAQGDSIACLNSIGFSPVSIKAYNPDDVFGNAYYTQAGESDFWKLGVGVCTS